MYTLDKNANEWVLRVDQVKETRHCHPRNWSNITVEWCKIIDNIILKRGSSNMTLLEVEIRRYCCRNVPSGASYLDCILITRPTRLRQRVRIVWLQGDTIARWVSSSFDIDSGQTMSNAAQKIRRCDASTCRNCDGVIGSDPVHILQLFFSVSLNRHI